MQSNLLNFNLPSHTLNELGAACLSVAVVSAFTPVAGQAVLWTSALSVVLINTAFRATRAFNRFLMEKMEHNHSPSLAHRMVLSLQKKIDGLLNHLPACIFSFFDSFTRDTLVHELGHATLFHALFKGNTQITISPPSGGFTRMKMKGVRLLGRVLGEKKSIGLLVGAGPGFSMLSSLSLITAAHFHKEKSPEASRYFNWMAVQSLFQHALYALSAYFRNSPGHDFVILATLGIPPIAAAVTIVALPILLKMSLS